MSPEEFFDFLIHRNVISDGEENVEVTPSYIRLIERELEARLRLDDEKLGRKLSSMFNVPTPESGLVTQHRHLVARIGAIVDSIEDHEALNSDTKLSMALIIEQLIDGFPRTSGSPRRFLPVRGDQLDLVLWFYPKILLYVWKADCEPCQSIRSSLEALCDPPPESLKLVSTYGPNWQQLLEEKFDIIGAPTQVFWENNSVQTRLIGPQTQDVIKCEINALIDD